MGTTQELDNSEIISLMSVYLDEWTHRDSLLWKQVFTYFYATLITMLLPNLAGFIGITLPESIPAWVFPTIGMAMSVVFLYMSVGYSLRLQASGKTYRRLYELLEPQYRRMSITELRCGPLFSVPITMLLTVLMFCALIAIGVVLLIFA